MAIATGVPSSTAEANPASLPADAISYEDLYARWERGNWCATELDFSEDARQWREIFTEFERKAAVWNYCLFFWGEDAVTDNLSPYLDAAPLEEQKYFLATQQVDEARHAVFFKRFMHEVCGIGDGTAKGGLDAIKPQLTWGFRKVFDHLDLVADNLRRDKSLPNLAAAVALYHFVVEATLAQPGQHFITSYLEDRDLLPGFREGMVNIARDEQRHIGFGVKLVADLVREDPRCRVAIADMIRIVTPWTIGVLVPPNWDRRYTEVFGFTLEEIGAEGALSLETKMRSAGIPLESLPGPQIMPIDLEPLERAKRGIGLVEKGFMGEKVGPPARDAESVALLMDTIRRSVDPDHGFDRPVTIQWKFSDLDPWYLRIDNGSTKVEPGIATDSDLVLRSSFEDWVDIVADRLDPRRAMLTRKLRPSGSPRVLLKLGSLFGA
jgi:putative sterol carrier protein